MTAQDLMTIIGMNIAMFAVFSTMMYWMMNRIDSDVKSACTRLDGHAMRIDQLYKMFVDLLKEGRK